MRFLCSLLLLVAALAALAPFAAGAGRRDESRTAAEAMSLADLSAASRLSFALRGPAAAGGGDVDDPSLCGSRSCPFSGGSCCGEQSGFACCPSASACVSGADNQALCAHDDVVEAESRSFVRSLHPERALHVAKVCDCHPDQVCECKDPIPKGACPCDGSGGDVFARKASAGGKADDKEKTLTERRALEEDEWGNKLTSVQLKMAKAHEFCGCQPKEDLDNLLQEASDRLKRLSSKAGALEQRLGGVLSPSKDAAAVSRVLDDHKKAVALHKAQVKEYTEAMDAHTKAQAHATAMRAAAKQKAAIAAAKAVANPTRDKAERDAALTDAKMSIAAVQKEPRLT